MTAAEWDALPLDRKVTWIRDGYYCACICYRPLPQWMAEQRECPDCGKDKAVIVRWLPIPERP